MIAVLTAIYILDERYKRKRIAEVEEKLRGRIEMTFEEALKLVEEKASVYWGTYRVENLVNDLQETYAPKIKMTKRESDMLKRLKKTPQISVGIVDYNGREPKVLLSNESYFVDAWLRPELIEVKDD